MLLLVVCNRQYYARDTQHDVSDDFPTDNRCLSRLADPIGDTHKDNGTKIDRCRIRWECLSLDQ